MHISDSIKIIIKVHVHDDIENPLSERSEGTRMLSLKEILNFFFGGGGNVYKLKKNQNSDYISNKTLIRIETSNLKSLKS